MERLHSQGSVPDGLPDDELVPVHPEQVADDEQSLRWSIPAATLAFVGNPAEVPPRLQRLVDDGTLEAVSVQPASVRTKLGVGRAWRDEGARVRSALQAALATPEGWRPRADASGDDVLRMAVREVIDGEVGDYIRSHGGRVRLVAVRAGNAEVELSGACSHCPASGITLTDRLEVGIRALYPGLGRLTAHSDPGLGTGQRLLRLLPVNRPKADRRPGGPARPDARP